MNAKEGGQEKVKLLLHSQEGMPHGEIDFNYQASTFWGSMGSLKVNFAQWLPGRCGHRGVLLMVPMSMVAEGGLRRKDIRG